MEGADELGDALPPPRENALLFGHEAAEAALLDAALSGRLPHAWLISGPSGVGKATLAFRFARFLLAGAAAKWGSSARRRDPCRSNRPTRPFAASPRAATPIFTWSSAASIPAARSCAARSSSRTREASAPSSHLTPAEGHWRVVIVDDADQMNRNAANALLKVLEEPPKRAVLLLLSDNPGRLLPTIRSRCRMLALKPLSAGAVVRRCGATGRTWRRKMTTAPRPARRRQHRPRVRPGRGRRTGALSRHAGHDGRSPRLDVRGAARLRRQG